MEQRNRLCEIPACEGRHYARGWCHKHYCRWRAHGDPLVCKLGKPLQWLQEQISTRDRSEGCWEWPFGRFATGYGLIKYLTKLTKAHRVALILDGQPQPDGAWALHSCDNPPCVNPAHLRWGSAQDNSNDRVIRNRAPRGSNNRIAKLTEDQVVAILQDSRTAVAIAADYGVSAANVGHIRRGKAWTHVPREAINARG